MSKSSASSGARTPGPKNPHDAVFRRFLSRPTDAAGELRAVLPASVATLAAWDQLTHVPGSFIDPGLGERETDVLFTVPVGGGNAFVYVLAEHQSSQDQRMPLRMLRYMIRIWDQFLSENPNSRLPPIFPVVISNAEGSWQSPCTLSELINADQAIVAAFEEIIRFGFILDDLATVDVAALRDRALTPRALMVLMALKTARNNPAVTVLLTEFTDELLGIAGDEDDLVALLTYIIVVSETPAEDLRRAAAALAPAIEEAYMTTAEMLRNEGRVEGRAEGRVVGRVEGRAEMLLHQIVLKFGTPTDSTTAVIRNATDDQLIEWSARILQAPTIEDLLS